MTATAIHHDYWKRRQRYRLGDTVIVNGVTYRCKWPHKTRWYDTFSRDQHHLWEQVNEKPKP